MRGKDFETRRSDFAICSYNFESYSVLFGDCSKIFDSCRKDFEVCGYNIEEVGKVLDKY